MKMNRASSQSDSIHVSLGVFVLLQRTCGCKKNYTKVNAINVYIFLSFSALQHHSLKHECMVMYLAWERVDLKGLGCNECSSMSGIISCQSPKDYLDHSEHNICFDCFFFLVLIVLFGMSMYNWWCSYLIACFLDHLHGENDLTLFFIIEKVLTKDSVTVSVDAVVYYRVSNATVSVANVENAHHSTRLLAQTTLRNILGTKNLHEILSDRESISGSMQARMVFMFTTALRYHLIWLHLHLAGSVRRSHHCLGHQSGACRNVSESQALDLRALFLPQSNLDEATAAWGIKVERVEMWVPREREKER